MTYVFKWCYRCKSVAEDLCAFSLLWTSSQHI